MELVSRLLGLCLAAEHLLHVYPAVRLLLADGAPSAAPGADELRRRAGRVPCYGAGDAGGPGALRRADISGNSNAADRAAAAVADRVPPRLGLAGAFGLFLLVRNINDGFLGFAGVPILMLPRSWYANLFTAGLGFPGPGFVSSDYFSLLPWLLLFWTGYFLYRLRPAEPLLPDIRLPGFSAMGRHSLLIYLLHQPVLYALLVLLPTFL